MKFAKSFYQMRGATFISPAKDQNANKDNDANESQSENKAALYDQI